MEGIQRRQLEVSNELYDMEGKLPKPTMAIYEITAPLLGLGPNALNTLVRLLWAGALTLSPLVIMILVSGELGSKKVSKKRNEERQKNAVQTCNSGTQNDFAAHVEPVKGHNGTTPVEALNGLNYAKEWLEGQPIGRITRHKIALVSKIKGREGVTKVIDALIDLGMLERLNNGQLSKPKHRLRLIK